MSGRKSKIIAGTVLLLLVMCFMVFLYRNSTRGQFESSLPSEYSSDVTMREIKEDVDDFIGLGLVSGLGDEYFRFGTCKFMIDGGTSGPSSLMRENYSHEPEKNGVMSFTQDEVDELIANGQVATQYVNPANGLPDMGIDCNPNGSVACIGGIVSPDGRVFGKMGHTERSGVYIAKNIPGDKLQTIFESGALYFR